MNNFVELSTTFNLLYKQFVMLSIVVIFTCSAFIYLLFGLYGIVALLATLGLYFVFEKQFKGK